MERAPVRIAAISLAATACLLALKLAAGILSDSIAVLGDAVDSGTDLAAATAALFAVRIAGQPADEEHPYGHGKVEAMSAGVAATIVAIGGTFVVIQALRRLFGEQPDIDVGIGLVAMLIAAGVNLVLAVFMRREADRSRSMALMAESKHLQTNVVQAGTIIAALALVAVTGEEIFDPLFALGLAAYMGWIAYGLVRTAAADIMDTALPESELNVISDVIISHPEVRGFHRLRTRRSGADRHVDMHVLVDAQLTVEKSHEITETIEHEIEAALPGTTVVIHLEPDDGRHRGPLEPAPTNPADTL
jgi:cation diffusion facilitator family transporter